MAITLTPAAADRIRSYLAETPGGIGLRFGVRKSGCTGFAYVVDIATAPGPDDSVFETDGVAVRVAVLTSLTRGLSACSSTSP